jgi:predicted ATPase
VKRWLDLAPQATVLITSRERLHLTGEQCFELEPLPVPDPSERDTAAVCANEAVALFAERARLLRPGYSLEKSPAEASTVAGIVRALDGIPLAIELCAARMDMLAPAQIAERLGRRLDLLVTRTRNAAARVATMRGAIDWSWELLEPWQREVLAQCSVFCGGFDLEAAERVLDLGRARPGATPRDALDALQALCDRSLLASFETSPGIRRYRLYESIREYAADRLGVDRTLEQRHAAYYLELGRRNADRVEGEDGADALVAITADLDNLLAVYARASTEAPCSPRDVEQAIDALCCLEPVFVLRGPSRRLLEGLLRVVAEPAFPELSKAKRASTMRLLGIASTMCGKWREAIAAFEQSFELAEEVGDRITAAFALTMLMNAHALQGATEKAKIYYAQAADRMREGASPAARGMLARHYGLVQARAGNTDASIAEYQRALELFIVSGSLRDQGIVLGPLGMRFFERGELPKARHYFARAIETLHRIGDVRHEALYSAQLGAVAQEEGATDEARELLLRAVELLRQVGDPVYEAWVRGMQGHLEFETGAVVEAVGRYREVVHHFDRFGDPLPKSMFRETQAAALASLGLVDEAEAIFAEVDALASMVAPSVRCRAFRAMVSVAAARRRGTDSEDDVAPYWALFDEARDGPRDETDRFALRLLAAELERHVRMHNERPSASPTDSLKVAADGRAFQRTGRDAVDLRRRGALSRILRALTARRIEAGAPLSLDEVFRAGWPGQRIPAASSAARVYNAVQRLRRLGLDGLLITRDDGYLLDDQVDVQWFVVPP